MSKQPPSSATPVPPAAQPLVHSNGRSDGASSSTSDVDAAYLELAWRLMDGLHCGPLLSSFRVFSILAFTLPQRLPATASATPLYYSASPPTSEQHPHTRSAHSSSQLTGVVPQRHPQLQHAFEGQPVYFLTGTNTESAWLGGSICAERSALTQLRQLPYGQVLSVYLVSQLSTPLAPGLMCREMLLQFVPLDTRIVMAARRVGSGVQVVKALTMRQLYPHPPLHLHVSSPHLIAYSQQLASKRSDPALSSLPPAIKLHVLKLLSSDSLSLPTSGSASSHYPLRFRASVFALSDDGSCASSVSSGSSCVDEWSHSLDPLTACLQLLPTLQAQPAPSSLLFVQYDQHGVLHAPFAAARAHLTQRGYGSAWCVFHDWRGEAAEAAEGSELELLCVQISDLVVDGGDLQGVDLCHG